MDFFLSVFHGVPACGEHAGKSLQAQTAVVWGTGFLKEPAGGAQAQLRQRAAEPTG